MTDTLVSLHNVSYTPRSHTKPLVENISLSLYAGYILTLIGPNGAGKTTLAKIVTGLIKPSHGHVDRKKELRLAYMPQKVTPNPFLPMTGREFLALSKSTQHHVKNNFFYTLYQSLHKSLESFIDRPLAKLSGGEWQKILFVRCLMTEPDLLILDEPTQGVDLFAEQDMYHCFQELRDQAGMSLLIVSHDLHFVFRASDNVVCLNRHICCSGAPSIVTKSEAYLSLFPNFSLYHHSHDHRHNDI